MSEFPSLAVGAEVVNRWMASWIIRQQYLSAQQKIEWVWLLEQHPDLFAKAMEYEKDGYKWMDSETLVELMQPARVVAIKEEFLKRTGRADVSSAKLLDFLLEDEDLGCASCFV